MRVEKTGNIRENSSRLPSPVYEQRCLYQQNTPYEETYALL
jgi:hypothetical protein